MATKRKQASPPFCPPRFGTERNPERPTLGPHVGRVAAALGKKPMPWQQHVLDVALEVGPDGRLVYQRVVLTVPRQSGKTTLVLPLIVHRSIADLPGGLMDEGPQPQTVVYTAQTRNDARKKWLKSFTPTLEASPFRDLFSKRLTNGSEGWDWANRSTFDLMATMEKSGHGDTLDLGIIDEAFAQQDDRLETAMDPATVTRQSPQIWIVSTAGENPAKSPFLWSHVQAGRKAVEEGRQTDTAYFEWSVGDDEDADDIDVVAARHPAVGFTITKETLARAYERAKLRGDDVEEEGDTPGLPGFYRSYCNRWGAVDADARGVKLPAREWADTIETDESKLPPAELGRETLAFAVDADGVSAAIAIGAGTLAAPYVEVEAFEKSTGWLPDAIVRLVREREPVAVVCNGAGATGAQVGPILAALQRAGLDVDITQLGATEWARACQGFYVDVMEGRLVRPAGQGPLEVAAGDATERPVGEGWAWDARHAISPLSPLEAVTAARAVLREPDEEEVPNVW